MLLSQPSSPREISVSQNDELLSVPTSPSSRRSRSNSELICPLTPTSNRNRKAHVWVHFNYDKSTKQAICRYCQKRFSTKGTSSLAKHAQNQHRIIMDSNSNSDFPLNHGKSRPSVNWSEEQSQEFRQELLRWLVTSNIPFNAINNLHCQKLFQLLCWHVPHRTTIWRSLDNEYQEMVQSVKNYLKYINYIALTTDATFVTSRQVPYICVTAHFIEGDWNLRECVLAMKEVPQSQTFDVIVKLIRDVINDFNLTEKIVSITTDEGGNFLKAVDHLINEKVVVNHVRCVCHRQSICLKSPSVKTSSLKSAVTRAQTLVTSFKNGWNQHKRDQFKKAQSIYIAQLQQQHDERMAIRLQRDLDRQIQFEDREANAEFAFIGMDNTSDEPRTLEMMARDINKLKNSRSLILDVATRWKSCYDMIKRLLLWYPAIENTVNNQMPATVSDKSLREQKEKLLTEEERALLSDYCDIAKIIIQAIGTLEASSATSSIVLYVLSKTKRRLMAIKTKLSDLSPLKILIDKILNCYWEKFGTYLSEPVFVKSMLLDPRWKFQEFYDDFQIGMHNDSSPSIAPKDAAWQMLSQEFINYYNSEQKKNIDADIQSESKRRRLEFHKSKTPKHGNITAFEMEDESRDVRRSLSEIVRQQNIAQQWDTFTNSPVANSESDPIHWWRENEHRFPDLAQLARKYFCIPASSASSERLWSSAGLIWTDLRNRLDSSTIEQMLFISTNSRLFNEIIADDAPVLEEDEWI
jgi:uncharacterized Zn-finger protein